MRPRQALCWPRWELVPQTISSISAVLTLLRSAIALSTADPSCWGWKVDSEPLPRLPMPRGVRQASMIQTSFMVITSVGGGDDGDATGQVTELKHKVASPGVPGRRRARTCDPGVLPPLY